MKWGLFIVLICYLCPPGDLLAFMSLIQEMEGSNTFFNKHFPKSVDFTEFIQEKLDLAHHSGFTLLFRDAQSVDFFFQLN